MAGTPMTLLNGDPKQSEQAEPKNAEEMPVERDGAHSRLAPGILSRTADCGSDAGEERKADQKQSAVGPGDQVKEKTAGIGRDAYALQTEFLPREDLSCQKRGA